MGHTFTSQDNFRYYYGDGINAFATNTCYPYLNSATSLFDRFYAGCQISVTGNPPSTNLWQVISGNWYLDRIYVGESLYSCLKCDTTGGSIKFYNPYPSITALSGSHFYADIAVFPGNSGIMDINGVKCSGYIGHSIYGNYSAYAFSYKDRAVGLFSDLPTDNTLAFYGKPDGYKIAVGGLRSPYTRSFYDGATYEEPANSINDITITVDKLGADGFCAINYIEYKWPIPQCMSNIYPWSCRYFPEYMSVSINGVSTGQHFPPYNGFLNRKYNGVCDSFVGITGGISGVWSSASGAWLTYYEESFKIVADPETCFSTIRYVINSQLYEPNELSIDINPPAPPTGSQILYIYIGNDGSLKKYFKSPSDPVPSDIAISIRTASWHGDGYYLIGCPGSYCKFASNVGELCSSACSSLNGTYLVRRSNSNSFRYSYLFPSGAECSDFLACSCGYPQSLYIDVDFDSTSDMSYLDNEIGLDMTKYDDDYFYSPYFRAKIVTCTLAFRDGGPTYQFKSNYRVDCGFLDHNMSYDPSTRTLTVGDTYRMPHRDVSISPNTITLPIEAVSGWTGFPIFTPKIASIYISSSGTLEWTSGEQIYNIAVIRQPKPHLTNGGPYTIEDNRTLWKIGTDGWLYPNYIQHYYYSDYYSYGIYGELSNVGKLVTYPAHRFILNQNLYSIPSGVNIDIGGIKVPGNGYIYYDSSASLQVSFSGAPNEEIILSEIIDNSFPFPNIGLIINDYGINYWGITDYGRVHPQTYSNDDGYPTTFYDLSEFDFRFVAQSDKGCNYIHLYPSGYAVTQGDIVNSGAIERIDFYKSMMYADDINYSVSEQFYFLSLSYLPTSGTIRMLYFTELPIVYYHWNGSGTLTLKDLRPQPSGGRIGIVNRNTITKSVTWNDDKDLIVTLSPKGQYFSYWQDNILYMKNKPESIVIPNPDYPSGLWYVYYDGLDLKYQTSSSGIGFPHSYASFEHEVGFDKVYVCNVQKNLTRKVLPIYKAIDTNIEDQRINDMRKEFGTTYSRWEKGITFFPIENCHESIEVNNLTANDGLISTRTFVGPPAYGYTYSLCNVNDVSITLTPIFT